MTRAFGPIVEHDRVAEVAPIDEARRRFENLRAQLALVGVRLDRRLRGGFIAQRGELLVDLDDLREAAELLRRLAAQS